MSDDHQKPKEELALAVVYGPPGSVTIATVQALHAITPLSVDDCSIAEINSVDDWERNCSSGQHFIAVSQYPSPDIVERLRLEDIPALIVVDDPAVSLAFLGENEHSGLTSLRAVSASFSCLAGVFDRGDADIQSSNEEGVSAFLQNLTGHQDAVTDLSSHTRFERVQVYARELTNKLDHIRRRRGSDRSLAITSNESYVAMLPQFDDECHLKHDARVSWPGASFYLADFPGTPATFPVDLCGPGRCLIYGPYLHLPSGYWTCSITIGVGESVDAQPFSVEIVCGKVIAKGSFICEGSGLFEVDMSFSHVDPHIPLELRLFSDTGAIFGHLSSFEVAITVAI